MKLSVIVPVYNVEDYLEQCLDSILLQNFEDMEILCVDDVSMDGSSKLLRRYASRDSRIRVLSHEKNRGLSAARNTGLQAATGEYVLFVDSDDYLERDCLLRLVAEMDKDSLDVLFFQYDKFDDDSGEDIDEKQRGRYTDYSKVLAGREHFCRMLLKKKLLVMVWQAMYRRDFLNLNGILFTEGIRHEDYLLTFRTLMNARRVKGIEESCYAYRARGGSITDRPDEVSAQSVFYSMMEVLHYWHEGRFTDEENLAMMKFCKDMFVSYRKKSLGRTPEYTPLMFGTPDEAFMYELFSRGTCRVGLRPNFLPGEVKRLKDAQRICIYGAGKVGRDVLEYLLDLGILHEKIFFAVSEPGAYERLEGLPVKCIDELRGHAEGTLVLLSTLPCDHPDMERHLKELEITDYMEIV